jgi:hypothetical protein
MAREIQLDGAEISVIKAIGVGMGDVDGATLVQRCKGLEPADLMDTLKCLIDVGYVDADESALQDKEEFQSAKFRVNSGWSKELKEAIDPAEEPKKSKRVRRE